MARIPNFARLATRGVRALQPYVPGLPIEHLERQYGVRDAIKLASNENPLGPSPVALEAARAALQGIGLYPDGSGYELRRALGERHGVGAGQITLGNGSNDVLVLLAETFLGPRTEAIHSAYAFLVYGLAIQATGATARVAEAHRADETQPYGHDLAAMRALIGPRTRLVYIANPNNPTGTWLDAGPLREFIASLPPRVIVVVDEAYAEYVVAADFPDTTSWLQEFPNLVVTRTFSKIFGLAGLRVGYAVSHPRVAELLNRVRQPFNVNSIGQAAALGALRDEEHVERSRQANATGLRQLADGLAVLGLGAAPSRGNFLLVNVGRPAGLLYDSLLRAGTIVRPVANYGLPHHLRITVGTQPQNVRLLQALAEALQASAGVAAS
jgi:histidinol-phosphate aminotransferase